MEGHDKKITAVCAYTFKFVSCHCLRILAVQPVIIKYAYIANDVTSLLYTRPYIVSPKTPRQHMLDFLIITTSADIHVTRLSLMSTDVDCG